MKCAMILMRFQKFDEGTQLTFFRKPKLIIFPDVLHNQAPQSLISIFMK